MKWMVSIAVAALAAVALGRPAAAAEDHGKCRLANGIEHIVYIQFDNVHLRRDNPNVPSDLEQMPNLLNLFEDKGTLFTNHHTPLISHTAVDIVTSLTGGLRRQVRFFDRQQLWALRPERCGDVPELLHLLDRCLG
jgi:hypothetical protein